MVVPHARRRSDSGHRVCDSAHRRGDGVRLRGRVAGAASRCRPRTGQQRCAMKVWVRGSPMRQPANKNRQQFTGRRRAPLDQHAQARSTLRRRTRAFSSQIRSSATNRIDPLANVGGLARWRPSGPAVPNCEDAVGRARCSARKDVRFAGDLASDVRPGSTHRETEGTEVARRVWTNRDANVEENAPNTIDPDRRAFFRSSALSIAPTLRATSVPTVPLCLILGRVRRANARRTRANASRMIANTARTWPDGRITVEDGARP